MSVMPIVLSPLQDALLNARALRAQSFVIVISAPSGAGKTTLCRKLMESDPRLKPAMSVTTRPMRAGEIDGVDYKFLSEPEFLKLFEEDAFLETAHVHGNHYGVLRSSVAEALDRNADVLVDCDWQGRQRLAAEFGSRLVSIFILPPSVPELRARLVGRGKDAPEVIERRVANAMDEIGHWREYDHVVVNDDLDCALRDLQAILAAERTRVARAAE